MAVVSYLSIFWLWFPRHKDGSGGLIGSDLDEFDDFEVLRLFL